MRGYEKDIVRLEKQYQPRQITKLGNIWPAMNCFVLAVHPFSEYGACQ